VLLLRAGAMHALGEVLLPIYVNLKPAQATAVGSAAQQHAEIKGTKAAVQYFGFCHEQHNSCMLPQQRIYFSGML
jgi:hypothetical protein